MRETRILLPIGWRGALRTLLMPWTKVCIEVVIRHQQGNFTCPGATRISTQEIEP